MHEFDGKRAYPLISVLFLPLYFFNPILGVLISLLNFFLEVISDFKQEPNVISMLGLVRFYGLRKD